MARRLFTTITLFALAFTAFAEEEKTEVLSFPQGSLQNPFRTRHPLLGPSVSAAILRLPAAAGPLSP